STCHWCHVMADESFKDQATAEYLNKNFISIKVDREEYPDLDAYYQNACQVFIQSGGWPLSAFLLPDTKPFFVGTYFPKVAVEEGSASFRQLLEELNRAYHESSEEVVKNAEDVSQVIINGPANLEKIEFPAHFPDPVSILDAIKEYRDEENGGYGSAPKFPHFAFYEWALEQMLEGMVPKEQGEHIVNSLEAMLMGGVFDHARGGIHRYSTDDKFKVPHFEKMLYDQAGLLRVLSKFSTLYPSPLVYDALINTIDYLDKEMLADSKYFFSAQDADSEGMEGLYFTYSEEEFEKLVFSVEEDADLEKIKSWFGISKEGNFLQGFNVISLNNEHKAEVFTKDSWETIRKIRKAILEDRKERIPPATDPKGVASWNFLLISSLVDVMQYCQIDSIKQQASQLFNQVVEGIFNAFLIREDEQTMMLCHTTTLKQSLPYFEDYVFFAESQLRVYEITGDPIFKNNLEDTLNFILKEFVKDKQLITRSVSTDDHQLYPNIKQGAYDNSFKSPASTLLGICRRADLLIPQSEFSHALAEVREDLIQEALRNPLSAGEALRSFTYPEKAYRLVKVPRSWLEKPQFVSFLSYFMPRFVLDYQNESSENWQICNSEACELQGEGLENFISTLVPKTPEEAK
ncbi:MAG: thioredoxin domain-containing protein, partial [Halobacteriovoraceae bacterium]|nr:thioredoxin domain-containing protein [Halobacteriovoraceae bacterium]